ncbi:MAG TPA: NAD-dependent epimerase/dehydratase [Actinophytocola sp.]|uniref:NAD-dependent epimerase/dehydratase family protein n=1 Tax=Actinophytocola sp. TaxID=1872138 RepID=UPI002DBB46CA|nr:NAD-dependent epimerase/dehydratase [Actinophytocola sp.]HEU5471630.1 NAD-dependent epimerase/dehydratase [Actinophytocola sp.]
MRPLVVVLGASGFIGSAVARALARQPVRLRLVARRPAPSPVDPVADIEVCAADLTAPGVLAGAVAGADTIVHLVAYTEGGWRVADGDAVAERINVGLVRDLIDVLAGFDRAPAVLFAGTDTQVGLTAHDRIDGTEPDRPRCAYSRHKLTAETLLKRATAAGVLRAVSLRLPTVYGHGPDSTADDRGVVAFMVRRALAGHDLTMWNDGSVRRDFVYIDDVTAAFTAAAAHVEALAGAHWLIGTGTGEPLGKVFTAIAELVARHTGRPPAPVVSIPPPPHAEPTDLKSVEIDSTAFRTVTGWQPRIPLHEGLRRTVTAIAG